MARIFLSYAHEDQAAAKRIVDALAREGLEAWWDHEIPPGSTWDEVIGQRIIGAQIVIAIWSRRSVASNFVKEEAQLAQDAGKLLPVKVEDVEPPIGFRRVHAANLVDWRGEAEHRQWQVLLGELRRRLGQPAQVKRTAPLAAAPATPNPGNAQLALVGGVVVAMLAIGLYSMQQGGREEPQVNAPPSGETTPIPPPEVTPTELADTRWSGVLTIGASQHRIEIRFYDTGEALLVSDTSFEQQWVWRYVDEGFEITGHEQRFTGAVRGGVMSGEYQGARGAGAFQLFPES